MRARSDTKTAQRISLIAVAVLFATEAYSQSADNSECQQAVVASSGVATMPQLSDLSYRCMKLSDGRHMWVGVANETAVDTVLLIHGMGNNAHLDWRSVVPSLLPAFRIVAVDLPGFGASPASPTGYSFEGISDALVETLDQLRISRTNVVGHSLGGAVSLHFAHAHPDRVDRLTLIDAAGILHRAMVVRYLARIDTPKTGIAALDRLSSTVDRSINDQLILRFLRGVDSREDFSNWLTKNPSIRNAMIGSRTQVDAAIGLVEHDFTEAIHATNAPTTLIWGRDDPIAPVRTGEMLAARMPDARIHVFDGVGHVPMAEAQFNSVLLEALLQDLPPKFVVAPAETQQDVVECNEQKGVKFTGHIAKLKIKHCSNVIVEFAQIGEMTLESSTVIIRYSSIEHSATALTADRSRVVATAVDIKGAVAVESIGSELDFAGVTLTASERAMDISGRSRIYFSVSDVDSPTYRGNAHTIWTKAP